MHTYQCFGIWVKSLRLTQGWTQHELAQRIGCSVSTIRKIETRERHPSRQVAELLAKHLAVPLDVVDAFLKAANCTRQSPRSDTAAVLPNTQV
ncbi:MAG: helix-turn-helix transcriptional regulator, partial [Chloroflexales bacterium]|nr:helix-turn-helix transcriptional regulator [Chloroflexales bacterium]